MSATDSSIKTPMTHTNHQLMLLLKMRHLASKFLPGNLRATAHFRYLAFQGGYRHANLVDWIERHGAKKVLARQAVHECMRVELEPYFKRGVFQHFFPGRSREEALLAAADNWLYGRRIEEEVIPDWASSSTESFDHELANIRVMNESLIHAVQYCGGWREPYLQGKYSEAQAGFAGFAARVPRYPGRLLEIGTGGMPFYPLYRDRKDWVGSDLLLSGIRFMRFALGLENKPFVCNDAQALPFVDESFHVVISRYVIEAVMRPELMLSEIFRVLCPGGTVILYVPPGSLQGVSSKYYTNRANFPTQSEFLELLGKLGFSGVDYDPSQSIFTMQRPGKLDTSKWNTGLQSPDSKSPLKSIDAEYATFADGTRYPVIEGVPVLLAQRFLTPHTGVLRPSTDPVQNPTCQKSFVQR